MGKKRICIAANEATAKNWDEIAKKLSKYGFETKSKIFEKMVLLLLDKANDKEFLKELNNAGLFL